MIYFFYGTLCDPDVHRLILGYRPSRRQLRPAILPGFRRKQARGRSYPVLIPAPAGRVAGLLFQAARPADAVRLAAYEGPEYIARRRLVRARHAPASQPALVFLPVPARLPAGLADWQPAAWRRHAKPAFLRSLHDQGPQPCANP